MRIPSQTFSFVKRRKEPYNALMSGVFIVFTLLSALRRGIAVSQVWQIFQQLDLPYPKTAFWLALCQQASLLTQHLRPSTFFHTWLGWQFDAQILHLFTAWERAPRNRQERLLRRRLILRLAQEQPLRTSDARLLPGLDALGITQGGSLTGLGKAAFGLEKFPAPVLGHAWRLAGNTLAVPFQQPDWPLLWRLEAFLPPIAPFTYQVDKNLARQPGQAEQLIEILETGTDAPLPGSVRARLLGQPSLQTSTGLVLEFSDPAELRQLRRSPALRHHFERLLSPRHAFVETANAPRLLKMLERRGIYAFSLPQIHPASSDAFGEGLGVGSGVEPVLPAPVPQAQVIYGETRTHFSRAGLLEPLGEPVPVLDFIRKAIRQQTAFEMLYHAPYGERPEIHRTTPLLIEERGGYTYIIAYSHTRRGQRTYRLDRMEVPGTFNAR